MSDETREASVEFPCGCPASRNGCDHWQRRVPAAEPAQPNSPDTAQPARKPVAMSVDNESEVLVLCDDGAVFWMDCADESPDWITLRPIPGTAAARTQEQSE